MVEKLITSPENVVDFARYQADRNGRAVAISARSCRHCYESVLFGLGPGQWFNLAMAAIGLTIMLVCRRRAVPVEPSRPAPTVSRATAETHARLRPLRAVLVVALILFPLCIPNSWTIEYLHLKRTGDVRGSDRVPSLIVPAVSATAGGTAVARR